MKMVKSLLLGTAAGLLAVAGAQAADMPVKAKPVEYVKICSLYGAGFYYIPGTDTCLKIGGYVRVQTEMKAGASGQVFGTGGVLGSGRYDIEDTNDINYTVRAVATFDARTQTEYGTLRSYIRAGWNQSTPAVSGAGTTPCNVAAANNCLAYWDRAFIQFAGFTVGRAQSFFDMYTYGGAYTYLNIRTSGDTGAAGEDLWAYTVQFGNGVSYTLSLEDPAAHDKYGTYDNTAGGLLRLRGRDRAEQRLHHPGRGQQRLPRSGCRHQPAHRPGLGLPRRVDRDPRRERRLLQHRRRARHRQRRPSRHHLRLGGFGLWLLQSPGRRLVRLQLRVDQGRAGLCLQLRQLAVLQQLQQRRRGLGGRRRVRQRHHGRADQGVEHQRRLPAHLGRGGAWGDASLLQRLVPSTYC